MVARISTFATNNSLFNQTQRLQSSYANATMQSSSGLKSENFEGISGDAQHLLALESENTTLTGQALTIKAGQNRIGAVQNTVDTISSTLSSASALLAQVQGGIDVTGGAASNVAQATTIRDQLVGLLNAQVGGEYLFGGNVYDKPPVNINAPTYNPSATPTVPNTNYYQGDSSVNTVRVSNSLQVGYGVTADNPAFEQALRALDNFIANPTDPTTISQSFALIQSSIAGTADISGTLTAKSDIISSEADLNNSTSSYLGQLISGYRDADVAAAAVQVSQLDNQLQSSFGALSKLLNLRLSDYLK